MYLGEYEDDMELGGIGRKFKKLRRKVTRPVTKPLEKVTKKIARPVTKVTRTVTRPLEKVARETGVTKVLRKAAPFALAPVAAVSAVKDKRVAIINPALALNIRSAQKATQAPLRRVVAMLRPVHAGTRVATNGRREPLLNVATKPPAFIPLPATAPSTEGPIPLPAPAASIPTRDFDGSPMTIAERAPFIEDAEPMAEPYSSGYVPDDGEEVFAPDVPEMIAPQDLQPTAPKKSPLPAIGGLFLLLNLLS